MRLAGAAVAEQHDGLAPFDPLAALQGGEHGRVDGGTAPKSKSARCLGLGKRASAPSRAALTVEATSRALRLPTVRELGGTLAEAALRDRLTHLGYLAELLQAERDDRDARRRERRVHGRAHRALAAGSAS